MVAAVDPIVGVIGAAFLGALGAYGAAYKKLSGTVDSSEATDLWQEVERQRQWSERQLIEQRTWSEQRVAVLTADVERLEKRIRLMEDHATGLNETITGLRQKVLELEAQIRACKSELSGSRGEIEGLTNRLAKARERITELESERS